MDISYILKRVKEIEIKTGKLVSETLSGQYQSIFKGKGIEFAEVREYVVGDDVRTIDWNITARTGKVYVKKFNEERELTIMVACDVSGSQHFGTRKQFKNEIGAELAAIFMFAALKNNDKVGLFLFSNQQELYVPPNKGKEHVLRIIRDMLAFQPKSKKTSISNSLKSLNNLLKRRSIIILISDFMDTGFEKAIKITERKHDLIPVILNDEIEINLKNLPLLIPYINEETGEKGYIDLNDYYTVNSYNKTFKRRREELKKLFKSNYIDYIELTSISDIYREVINFFNKRKLRIKK